MSYRILFMVNAFVAALFGLALLVAPGLTIGWFQVDEYASTRLIAQFFGAAMLTLGLLLWLARVPDERVQRAMAIALLVGAAAGLSTTALGITSRTLRAHGWVVILIYLAFGLAYALLVFQKRGTETP